MTSIPALERLLAEATERNTQVAWENAESAAIDALPALIAAVKAAADCARFDSGGGSKRIAALREALAPLSFEEQA